MRLFKNPQMKIGEIRIEDIKIDKTSKDDVPRLLVGLQSIYSDKELLKKISDIMMEEILPEVNKKDGRQGMDFWQIFVLHILKRGANIDYERLRDYANSHIETRNFLGLSFEAGVTPHAIWHHLSHFECVLCKAFWHQIFSFA